jgi:hypothetical protein
MPYPRAKAHRQVPRAIRDRIQARAAVVCGPKQLQPNCTVEAVSETRSPHYSTARADWLHIVSVHLYRRDDRAADFYVARMADAVRAGGRNVAIDNGRGDNRNRYRCSRSVAQPTQRAAILTTVDIRCIGAAPTIKSKVST